jgi:phosphate transport system substrate-binding protein
MMLKKSTLLLTTLVAFLVLGATVVDSVAVTKQALRYSSSAQVREALGDEGLRAFTKATGIEIDLFVGSSSSAVHRLMYGLSDLASTVERLSDRHQQYGYTEILFCKAPLIVISNAKTAVRNISSSRLTDVFNGTITNWKALGGPDEPIIVVAPGKQTGAFKNFRQLALKHTEVKYDYMAYLSTDVVKLVKRIPWSISFISQGSETVHEAIKVLKIDGLSPADKGYPYFQTFSFVTKGKPCCEAEKLIEFAFSEEGRNILRKNGMTPILR